ncbi:MAG: hypothetical protein KKC46_01735 [Proteobacteria bacterium]|nr:hypothetical protein [Pseudomonadota bacterium]
MNADKHEFKALTRKKIKETFLFGVLGASSGLAGLAALSKCNGGNCSSCLGCGGIGLAVLLVTVGCRWFKKKE